MAPHIHEPISVAAVYEDGMFRPLEPLPLDLPEHTRVHLSVEMDTSTTITDQKLRAILASVGLELFEMPTDGLRPVSNEEREALGKRAKLGRPLSEIIIEERDGI